MALFVGWVLFVFVVSDLVGGLLRRWLARAAAPPAPDDGPATGGASLADATQSTLLGFAALWIVLSVAYALGIATRGVMAGAIGVSGVAAALAQRRQLAAWGRSRLVFWAVMAAVCVLASCVTPTFSGTDDPEYLFLIDKLLHTGSIVEYFNWRRPISLGGWTFLQAIFSAGPGGTSFVASIDSVFGGLFFLFCAALIEADAWMAFPAAVLGVLLVQPYQNNLGTATGMAATCAVLIGLTLPAPSPAADFTAMAFAVIAVTIRPQLGLVAIAAAAVVCLRGRARRYLSAGLAIVLVGLWIAIFVRDTSLLPLSLGAGYNPQVFALDAGSVGEQHSLVWQLGYLGRSHPKVVGLIALAAALYAWQFLTSSSTPAQRRNDRILAVFAMAATATVLVMVAVIGSRGWEYARYYVPIVEAVLYAFFISSFVRVLKREALAARVWVRAAGMAGALALAGAVGLSRASLSVPAVSSTRICAPLLTPSEQQAVDGLPGERGYTLLAMDCPVGSFEMSPNVMMSDLFSATRGDYVDIAWPTEAVVTWLRKEHIGQILYLDHATGWNFGLDQVRRWVESHPPSAPRWASREYNVETLEKFRDLARDCPSVRLPIADPRGPLVIVDVAQCAGRTSLGPAAAANRVGPSVP